MRQFTLAIALALACALAGLMGAGLAHAQIGHPAGMAPAPPRSEPGPPAPGHPDTDTADGAATFAGAAASAFADAGRTDARVGGCGVILDPAHRGRPGDGEQDHGGRTHHHPSGHGVTGLT